MISMTHRFIFILLFLFAHTALAQLTFEQLPLPDGGHLYAVTVTEAGTPLCMSMNTIYRGNSSSWEVAKKLPGSSVNVKHFAYGIDGAIFALTMGAGIWRSDDDGQSWSLMLGWSSYITGLAQIDASTFYASVHGEGFVISTDGGQNWTQHNEGIPELYLQDLVRDSAGRLFTGSNASTGTVYRSTDEGMTWVSLVSGPVAINDLIQTEDGRLVAAAYEGLWQSSDHGDSWSKLGQDAPFSSHLVWETASGEFVSIEMNGFFKVHYTQDNGSTWTQLSADADAGVVKGVTSDDEGNILLATSRKALLSPDKGASWTDISSGIKAIGVMDMTQLSSGTLLLATQYSGLLRSTNNGENWSNVDQGGNDTQYYVITRDAQDAAYAGSRFGEIFRSSDDGVTWTSLNAGNTFSSLQNMLVTSAGNILAAYGAGIALSTDEGATWQTGLDGVPDTRCLKIFEQQNGTLLAGVNRGGGLKSTDGGMTWTVLHPDLSSSSVSCFAQDGEQHLALGTQGAGVYLSSDAGATWSAAAHAIPSSYINDMFFAAKEMPICGTLYGVYLRTARGDEWIRVGEESLNVRSMSAAPDGRLLYATLSDGLFRSERPLPSSVPAIPSLRSPADAATGTGTIPVFSWEADADAMFYDIQIARDASMQDLIWDFAFPGSTSIAMDPNTLDTLTEYYWRLAAGNIGGRSAWSPTWRFNTGIPTTVERPPHPAELRIESAYPHPFNASTVIRFSMQSAASPVILLQDALGRTVATERPGWKEAGVHNLRINTSSLPAGWYTVVLESQGERTYKHILHLRS